MKIKFMVLALVIFLLRIASASEITVINDNLYFTTLHQELLQAKESIYAD